MIGGLLHEMLRGADGGTGVRSAKRKVTDTAKGLGTGFELRATTEYGIWGSGFYASVCVFEL